MSLKTDFFTVAQSGPTVDGREIKKQWLIDAAETYSQEKHLSKIWPEHMRYMPMGEIADVRYTENGELGNLEARISPNADLIYYVRQGRMNQPSIEIIEDFANSNKAYLYGLGATSNPASLGVGKMPILFNSQEAEGKSAIDLFTQRIALDANAPSSSVHIFASPTQWEDLEFKKERTFFDLGRFFKRDEPTTETQQSEDVEMTKEELQEALNGFRTTLRDELRQEFTGLRQEFSAAPAAPAAPAPAAPAAEAPAAEAPAAEAPAPAENHSTEVEAPSAEAETVPMAQFKELKDAHEKLEKKLNTFMNEEEPQPDAPEHGTTETQDVWNWK